MSIHGFLMTMNFFQAIILYDALLILPGWTALLEPTKMTSSATLVNTVFFLLSYLPSEPKL